MIHDTHTRPDDVSESESRLSVPRPPVPRPITHSGDQQPAERNLYYFLAASAQGQGGRASASGERRTQTRGDSDSIGLDSSTRTHVGSGARNPIHPWKTDEEIVCSSSLLDIEPLRHPAQVVPRFEPVAHLAQPRRLPPPLPALEQFQHFLAVARVEARRLRTARRDRPRADGPSRRGACGRVSAVWPQCWLCAVCAVGRAGCCVAGGVPCGGKHIIIAFSRAIRRAQSRRVRPGTANGRPRLGPRRCRPRR